MKSIKEVSYLRKETTYRDHGYMYFSNIEQDFRLLPTNYVTLIKLSQARPICGSDATIIVL